MPIGFILQRLINLGFSARDVVAILVALIAAIVTVVGWRKTYSYQRKLYELQVATEDRHL